MLAGSWLLSTALLAGSAAVRGGQIADALAVAAVAAIALALAVNHDATGGTRSPCCSRRCAHSPAACSCSAFASGILRSAERARGAGR